MDKRFHSGFIGKTFVVLDVTPDEFNKMDTRERPKHILVQINSGGMISPRIGANLERTNCRAAQPIRCGQCGRRKIAVRNHA